jgi:hypothetical protein
MPSQPSITVDMTIRIVLHIAEVVHSLQDSVHDHPRIIIHKYAGFLIIEQNISHSHHGDLWGVSPNTIEAQLHFSSIAPTP